ncbi:hypothetical protein GTY54_26940 [Streptomyces sp. SID625]|nr:hypothetical protein [Streptomyces sp. SID625]
MRRARAPWQALKNGPKTLAGKLNLAGMVLEDATPRQRAWFLGEMPAPARVLWRLVGARRCRLRADGPRHRGGRHGLSMAGTRRR